MKLYICKEGCLIQIWLKTVKKSRNEPKTNKKKYKLAEQPQNDE